ncbi:MAG: VOC family protein [Bacteroidota bacterium]
MMIANIYLNFNGNCEEAFDFYKSVFGGEFSYVGRFNEMPPQEGATAMSKEDGNKIMHISLPLGEGSALMGSDTGGEWAPGFTLGNNFSISLSPQSREETDRLYAALSAGGKTTMPMAETFWGDYFGMCEDRFGINWMFSYNEQGKKA